MPAGPGAPGTRLADGPGCPCHLLPRQPWWKGIPGLDEERPCADPVLAARFAAIGCAVYALAPDEHSPRWLRASGEEISLAGKWFDWLATAGDPAEAYVRRLTLRLVCDSGIDPDHVLRTARDLVDACTPRTRRGQR
jgi:hypothetical protein